MIWWTIIAAFGILLVIFALGGTCFDWGWQKGYRAGLDRREQIDRHPALRGDRLRGWQSPSNCCHGRPIDVQCPDCAALTAGL